MKTIPIIMTHVGQRKFRMSFDKKILDHFLAERCQDMYFKYRANAAAFINNKNYFWSMETPIIEKRRLIYLLAKKKKHL